MICSGVRRDAAAGSQWQKIEKKTGLRSGGSYRNWQLQTMEEVIGGSLANLSSHTIKRLIRRAIGQLIPVAMTYNNVCWREKLTSLSYGEQEDSFPPHSSTRDHMEQCEDFYLNASSSYVNCAYTDGGWDDCAIS